MARKIKKLKKYTYKRKNNKSRTVKKIKSRKVKKIKRNKRIKQKGGGILKIDFDTEIRAEEIYNFIFDSDFVNPNSLKLNKPITETTIQFTNVGVIHKFSQNYDKEKQQTVRTHIFIFNKVKYANYELIFIIKLVDNENTRPKDSFNIYVNKIKSYKNFVFEKNGDTLNIGEFYN